MIGKDCIETAYSFLHQKERIYAHSTLDWQKDDIEMAISAYVSEMNTDLYQMLARGRADFLRDHSTFANDIAEAVATLESMLYQ